MIPTTGKAPFIQCPVCRAQGELPAPQADAVAAGTVKRCPHCQAELECTELQTIKRWTWAPTAACAAAVEAAVKP